MEPSKDGVSNQIDEVQGTPQNLAAQMRAENEQTLANSPVREPSKDLANAASDPGAPNIANDLGYWTWTIQNECRVIVGLGLRKINNFVVMIYKLSEM